jgi:hypothetical protein
MTVRRADTVFQCCDQDDDDPEIDLAPKKAYRWWGGASPATVARTTKTQPELIGGIHDAPDTPWLPGIVGYVQLAATMSAARVTHLGGDSLIEQVELAIKTGRIEKRVTH